MVVWRMGDMFRSLRMRQSNQNFRLHEKRRRNAIENGAVSQIRRHRPFLNELSGGKTCHESIVYAMKRFCLLNGCGHESVVQYPSVRRERCLFDERQRLHELSLRQSSFPLQLQRHVQLQLVSVCWQCRLRSRISEQFDVHDFELVQQLFGMLGRRNVRHRNALPVQTLLLLDLRRFELMNQCELFVGGIYLVARCFRPISRYNRPNHAPCPATSRPSEEAPEPSTSFPD